MHIPCGSLNTHERVPKVQLTFIPGFQEFVQVAYTFLIKICRLMIYKGHVRRGFFGNVFIACGHVRKGNKSLSESTNSSSKINIYICQFLLHACALMMPISYADMPRSDTYFSAGEAAELSMLLEDVSRSCQAEAMHEQPQYGVGVNSLPDSQGAHVRSIQGKNENEVTECFFTQQDKQGMYSCRAQYSFGQAHTPSTCDLHASVGAYSSSMYFAIF